MLAVFLALILAGPARAQSTARQAATRDSLAEARRIAFQDSLARARVDSLRRAQTPPRPGAQPAAIDSLRRIVVQDSLRRAAIADSLARAGPDSLREASADSLARVVAAEAERASADSLAQLRQARRELELRRERPPKRPFDEPRWVMMRSLVVPGWGQLYNRSWIKALAVAGVELHLARLVVDDLRDLDGIQERIDAERQLPDSVRTPGLEEALVNDYNARLDTLTGHQWWLGAVVAYALLDAYIDAHFRNFEAEFEYDPALRGGEPSARVRLSYRWRF